MGMRNEGIASLERQAKRLLARRNLDLLKPQRLTPKIKEHGGYKVRDAATGEIVFGNAGYEFSATLDEVEAWLAALDTAADG